jgi:hypothetical protein
MNELVSPIKNSKGTMMMLMMMKIIIISQPGIRWCVIYTIKKSLINHLTPNGHFSGRTAPLTYRCLIFYLFNTYMY